MSAPDSTFEAMRSSLIERGLLTADFHLTEAGRAHSADLVEQLRHERIDEEFTGRALRWNTRRSGGNFDVVANLRDGRVTDFEVKHAEG